MAATKALATKQANVKPLPKNPPQPKTTKTKPWYNDKQSIDPDDIIDQIVFGLPRTKKANPQREFVDEGIRAGFTKRQLEVMLAVGKLANGSFKF